MPEASEDHAVAEQLRALAGEVAALRAEVRRAGGAALPEGRHGWADDADADLRGSVSHAWLSSLGPAPRAPLRVPRLPLELALIAGAAVLAGFAHLRPLEIAAVMAVAWLVVALAEWAGSRGDRMRMQILLGTPVAREPAPPASPDPAWFTPPVEQTLLASRERTGGDSATIVGSVAAASAPGETAEAG